MENSTKVCNCSVEDEYFSFDSGSESEKSHDVNKTIDSRPEINNQCLDSPAVTSSCPICKENITYNSDKNRYVVESVRETCKALLALCKYSSMKIDANWEHKENRTFDDLCRTVNKLVTLNNKNVYNSFISEMASGDSKGVCEELKTPSASSSTSCCCCCQSTQQSDEDAYEIYKQICFALHEISLKVDERQSAGKDSCGGGCPSCSSSCGNMSRGSDKSGKSDKCGDKKGKAGDKKGKDDGKKGKDDGKKEKDGDKKGKDGDKKGKDDGKKGDKKGKSGEKCENKDKDADKCDEKGDNDKKKDSKDGKDGESGELDANQMVCFVDSFLGDICQMQNVQEVMKYQATISKRPPPRQEQEPPPPPTPAVSIKSVRELGPNSLFIRWLAEDKNNIKGYEIYVDGVLTNRYNHPAYSAAVIDDVDTNSHHSIRVSAISSIEENSNPAVVTPIASGESSSQCKKCPNDVSFDV